MSDDPLALLRINLVCGTVNGEAVRYESEAVLEMLDYLERAAQQIRAADSLARETERRMNDLGGYDARFPVRRALNAYKKERGFE